MAKTKAQIIAEAQVVKNATEVGENTATRVGTVLEDLAEKINEYVSGRFYGYAATSADLPEGDEVGYAYVGSSPFEIWNFDGTTWSDSGVTIANAPVPNMEDIDYNTANELQFANRVYNSTTPDGLGYKILRKSSTFAAQVTEANTIYEVRYEFDLNGGSVTIPSGCVLKFNGGRVVNGTLNLTQAEIIGSGIDCDITNPSKFAQISNYIVDFSDTSKNTRVMQALLDARASIDLDVESITFSDYLSIKQHAHIISSANTGCLLSFPNSRGFVWDAASYSHSNYFANFKIVSDGHCFDMYNEGNTHPNNVWSTTWENLNLESANGYCITSGVDNKGNGGDSLCFDCRFVNVSVKSGTSCGFVGLVSNTMYFEKCRNYGCADAFLYNCGGVFISCNGTWGAQGGIFYKGRRLTTDGARSLYCRFVDCNIEDYSAATLVDCNDEKVYSGIIFEKCSFYIYGNNNVIDYNPVVIWTMRYFKFEHCLIEYPSGTYDNSHGFLKYKGSMVSGYIPISTDIDLPVVDTNNAKRTIHAEERKKIGTFLLSSDFNLTAFNYNYAIEVDKLRIGGFDFVVNNVTLTTNYFALSYFQFYNLKNNTDTVGTNRVLNYISTTSLFGTSSNYGGFEIFLRNGSTNATITLTHNYNTTGRLITYNGQNVVLQPSQTVRLLCINRKYKVFPPQLENNVIIPDSGTTTLRPSSPPEGFCYYDTTLGKPIWWNGTGWVDATGATA